MNSVAKESRIPEFGDVRGTTELGECLQKGGQELKGVQEWSPMVPIDVLQSGSKGQVRNRHNVSRSRKFTEPEDVVV